MLGKFFKEEKGQGAIEYILLAGGIIVAAVVIFAIYGRITETAANRLEGSTSGATSMLSSKIEAEVWFMT